MVYDVIVVGARCAGAVTALELARRGHRVLALDRARFPSDTLSTHNFSRETTRRFRELGVLDAIVATGAPPLRRLRQVAIAEGIEFTGTFLPVDGIEAGYCVRRITLDHILVQAARAAGAEVREATTVTDLLWEDGRVVGVQAREHGGPAYSVRAPVVVGADGRHSRVARWVHAPVTRADASLTPAYYAYFRNVAGPRDCVEVFRTARRAYLLLPTDGELTCVLIALTQAELASYRPALEHSYLADLRAVPELAERFARAERVGPIQGAVDLDLYLRVPWGPGWALVGDAGAHVHPVTARGIGLAVRDAMLLAEALSAVLTGSQAWAAALAGFHQLRDAESAPAYEGALAAAGMAGKPVPAELLALFSALARLPDDAARFISGQVRSPAEVAEIIARAQARNSPRDPAVAGANSVLERGIVRGTQA
jgi:flavin-dependent dehydrogenase